MRPSIWTPRYLVDRARVAYWRWRKPESPWLNPTCNNFLDDYIKEGDIGLEIGSGKSTLWLAKRSDYVTSIEHSEKWYTKVKESLESKGLGEKVNYIFAQEKEYVERVKKDKMEYDFVIVDGEFRAKCAYVSINKVKEGGILVIDDSHRYLPIESSAPSSYRDSNPNEKIWREVWDDLSEWRRYKTTSGVTDTTIFFKSTGD